jgi:flagellum-specific ATP synthase
VATSDQPALVRIKGAMTATAIAEFFRDQGMNVNLMIDSVTRFAMAQREIGLAIGEPPTTKGYTPSVFALLPRLLERAGTNANGSITAFYTVLVDGDDMNEPIADSVRGILDGHIVLDRNLVRKGIYPAIDILSSVSRVMKDIVTAEHLQAAEVLKRHTSVYQKAEDLIQIGAYKKGTDREIDRAVDVKGWIDKFVKQGTEESPSIVSTIEQLLYQFGENSI